MWQIFSVFLSLCICLPVLATSNLSLVSQIWELEEILNEYKDCLNIVYTFNARNTFFSAIGLLAPIVHVISDSVIKLNLKESDYTSRYSEFCVANFYQFPHEFKYSNATNAKYYFPFRDIYGRDSAISEQVVSHFFISTDFKNIENFPRLFDTGGGLSAIVFHYLTTENKFLASKRLNILITTQVYRISSSKVKYNRMHGQFIFRTVEPSHLTFRERMRVLSETLRAKPIMKKDDDYQNYTEDGLVSVNAAINERLTSPFRFKQSPFVSSLLGVIRLLCAMVHNVFVPATVDLSLIEKFWDPGLRHYLEGFKAFGTSFSQYSIYLEITGRKGMNFVTCNGVKQRLAFQIYAEPYDIVSWVLILFAISALPGIVMIFEHRNFQKWTEKLKFWSHIFCFNISVTLEVSPSIPQNYKLSGRTQCVLLTWLVSTLTLVNAYKGIVVAQLTSPAPLTRTWAHVNEMDGFAFIFFHLKTISEINKDSYQPYGTDVLEVRGVRAFQCFQSDLEFVKDMCNAWAYNKSFLFIPSHDFLEEQLNSRNISSLPLHEEYCSRSTALNSTRNFYKESSREKFAREFRNWLTAQPRLAANAADHFCDKAYFVSMVNVTEKTGRSSLPFNNGIIINTPKAHLDHSTSPKLAVLNVTSPCNRIAYIDYEKELDLFMELAHSQNYSNFKKGEEELFVALSGFEFPRNTWSSKEFLVAMHNLVATGMHAIWEKWLNIRYPSYEDTMISRYRKLRFVNPNLPTALDITSNIQTAFLIFIGGVLIAILLMLLEFPLSFLSAYCKFCHLNVCKLA